MVPLYLRLLNFISHEDTELSLDKIRAACIVGINGAGKTSISDAMLYALYGQTSRGRDNNLVRLGETEMAVIFDFEQSGRHYRVIRKKSKIGRGKNITELYLLNGQGTPEPIATGDAAKERILQILNRDFDTFTSSSFLLQGQGEKLITAKPTERLKIVSDILGLDKFGEYKKLASAESNKLEGQKKAMLENMEVFKEHAVKLPSLLISKGQNEKSLSDVRSSLMAKESRLALIAPEIAVIGSKLKDLDAISAEIALLEKEKEAAALAKYEAEKALPVVSSDVLNKFLAEDGLHRAMAEAAAYKARLGGIADAEKEITALLERKKSLEESIGDSRKSVKRYKKILDNKSKILEFVETEKAETEKLISLKSELEKVQAEMSSINKSIQRTSEINTLIAKLEQTISVREKDRQHALATAKTNLQKAQTAVLSLGNTICKGEGEFAACPLIKDAVELKGCVPALEKEISALEAPLEHSETPGIDALKKECAGIGNVKDKLNEATASEKSLKDSISKIEKSLETLRTWTKQSPEIEIAGVEQERLVSFIASTEKDIAAVSGRLKTLDEQKAEAQSLECQFKALEAVVMRLRNSAEISAIGLKISEVEKKISGLRARAGSFDELKIKLSQLSAEHLVLSAGLTDIKKQERDCLTGVSRLDAEILTCRQAEDRVKSLGEELKGIELEIRLYDALTDAYERIPYYILDNVVGIMEDEANRILEEISSTGMRVELRTEKTTKTSKAIKDTLDIIVSDVSGERPIEMYSGGEKTRQVLALTVGLAELSARKAGEKIKTILIDEPAGLDKQGQLDFARCLNLLVTSGTFEKAFLIAHDRDLLDAFEQKILVEKEGSVSRVTVVV